MACQRALQNRRLWMLVFDENALTYQDIKAMDLAEFEECMQGKQLYIEELERLREEAEEQREE